MSSLVARSLLRRAVAAPAGRFVWMSAQRCIAAPVGRGMVFTTASNTTLRCASTLSKLLAREYAEEEENGALEMPDELTELHANISKRWTILDDRESGTVKMFKKDGVAKVAVVFHCQDTIEGDYMMDEEQEENEEEFPSEIRFLVTVTKAGKTMVLSCVALEAKVSVESVATTTEEVDEIQAKGKVHDKLYQGPQFDELAEDVKDAFHNYVAKDCGIDSEVAAFISMFADFKEQEEYARWIKQVKAIVDK
jgi:complement component 1 Q subcomponent-binding protein